MRKKFIFIFILYLILNSISYANFGNLQHLKSDYTLRMSEILKERKPSIDATKINQILTSFKELQSKGIWNFTGQIFYNDTSIVDPGYNAGINKQIDASLSNAAKNNIALSLKNKKFAFPMNPDQATYISSGWGQRNIPYGSKHHNGIDISTIGMIARPNSNTCGNGGHRNTTADVMAPADGVVEFTGLFCGNTIEIKHTIPITGIGDRTLYTSYLHLDEISINTRTGKQFKKGDQVLVGDKIGLTGCSGTEYRKLKKNAYANHLHFTIADVSIKSKEYKWCSGSNCNQNSIKEYVSKHCLNPIGFMEIPEKVIKRTIQKHGMGNFLEDPIGSVPYKRGEVVYEWRR